MVDDPPVVPSCLDDLLLLVAEDVADDPLAVLLVDPVEVHPALDQVVVVLADGRGEGLRAARIRGVGLDPPEQRGQRLPGGLLRGALVHAEAVREVGQRNAGKNVVDSGHERHASGSRLPRIVERSFFSRVGCVGARTMWTTRHPSAKE